MIADSLNQATTSKLEGDLVKRFSLRMRVQHIVLLLTLIVLSVTGLALKYNDTTFGAALIYLEGGLEARGQLHRISAVVLMILAFYHAWWVIMTEEGHRELMLMKIKTRDVRDLFASWGHALGLRDDGPKIHKYGYKEKIQYWGVVIGCILITLSGFILWFESGAMAIVPKWFIDLTLVLHGGEGLLIFLVLLLWHLYNVHLSPGHFPVNRAFITGKIDKKELEIEHSLEFEELLSKKGEGE